MKILIIRFSSIGDVILTTPAIRHLKKKFPDSTIDFVIKKEFSELLIHHPGINKFYIYDKNSNFNALKDIKQEIKAERYDLILDLHKNFRSFYLTNNCKAEKIIKYKKGVIRRFFLVKLKLNFYRHVSPIFFRYLNCLSDYNIVYDSKGLDLYFNNETKKEILQKYSNFISNKESKTTGIAPGASFATKRWTIEGFSDVINYLSEKKTKIILFGNAKDREFISSLKIDNDENILNTCGQLSIIETSSLIDECDMLVCNDSGLMHIASSLKKKIVAIFGSTTEELGFFPFADNAIVIENKMLKCRPCSHIGRHECPKKHFKCMKDITSDQVIKAIDNFM